MIVGTRSPPRLPVAVERAPQVALDRQAVAGRDGDPLRRSGRGSGDSAARSTAGIESVTWRGRASSGATPGTGSSHRSCGAVSRSPTAATQAPSASQPTGRQTPSHGLIRLPVEAAETVRGVLGGRPRPRFGAVAAASSPTSRSWRPSWTSMWTNRLPSGEGSGAAAGATAGFAVLALALGQDDPIVAVGGQPDDLEPAVGVGHEQQRTVGQPARRDIDAPLAGHDARRAGRDVDEGDLRRLLDVRAAAGHDRDAGAVGRPFEGVDIEAGLGQDGRSRRLGLGRRPAAARDRRVDQPDLRPAAAARQERQAMAVGRPARFAAGAGLADHPGQARAVRFDDPDLVVADEREAAPVGRPLRVRDGLLRGGELDRIAAAQRQREELPRPGGLGRVGDDAGRAGGGGTRAACRPRRSPRSTGWATA